jgi:periplasmic divalent cation tolerance protein
MKLRLVVTTLDSEEKARAMAKALVERRLAACAQVTPIHSCYRWNSAIEEAREWRLELKTRAEATAALFEAIAQAHPYETPELIALDIVEASPAYRDWVRAQTSNV